MHEADQSLSGMGRSPDTREVCAVAFSLPGLTSFSRLRSN